MRHSPPSLRPRLGYLVNAASATALAAGLVVLATGCSATPQSTSGASSTQAVGTVGPIGQEPLCGVLTTSGPAAVMLVVPLALDDAPVLRYEVLPSPDLLPPLDVQAGWWVCVTEGEVLDAPSESSPDEVGTVRIDALSSDRSNAERGQD